MDFIKKKEHSFINERTTDSTLPRRPQHGIEPNQFNKYFRGAKEFRNSIDSTKSLTRPKSCTTINGLTPKKIIKPESPSMKILKSRKSIDESRAEQIRMINNKSFEANGNLIF
jgi:hypothetical protein